MLVEYIESKREVLSTAVSSLLAIVVVNSQRLRLRLLVLPLELITISGIVTYDVDEDVPVNLPSFEIEPNMVPFSNTKVVGAADELLLLLEVTALGVFTND